MLDEAGKIASRLEALKKADLEEPCDDLGRRKEKQKVMAVQTDTTKQKATKSENSRKRYNRTREN